VLVWVVLALGTACQAQSSIQAAQTAIVVGQTAFATVQPVVTLMQGTLAGANLKVTTQPDGAQPQDATDVTIEATDAQGNLAQVDPDTRQAAAAAALMAASQYYPKARVSLKVLDASGATLVSGSVQPGQQPAFQ